MFIHDNSRDDNIINNLKLINFTINKYCSGYLKKFGRDDLFQVGSIALIHAVDNYDESMAKFNTYAIDCIYKKIKRYCDSFSSSIHTSIRRHDDDVKKYNKNGYSDECDIEYMREFSIDKEDAFSEDCDDPWDYVVSIMVINDIINSLSNDDREIIYEWLYYGGCSSRGSRKMVKDNNNISLYRVKKSLSTFRKMIIDAGLYE